MAAHKSGARTVRKDTLSFGGIQVGATYSAEPYRVAFDEMYRFNRDWDPLPIHLSEAAALAAGHKALIASGQYTLCIKQHFMNRMPWREAVIGAIGFDELRFANPVHAGDEISITVTCIDKRLSKSKPDRGICKFRVQMSNQDGAPVLTYTDIVMLKSHRDSGN